MMGSQNGTPTIDNFSIAAQGIKLADWKPTHPTNDKDSHDNLVSIDENSTPSKLRLFSKEQLEILHKMFDQPQQTPLTSIIGTKSLA